MLLNRLQDLFVLIFLSMFVTLRAYFFKVSQYSFFRGQNRAYHSSFLSYQNPGSNLLESNHESNKHDETLTKALRDWRRRTADELQLPIYRVMNNQLLENVVKWKPRNKDELSFLPGMGRYSMRNYGDMILSLVERNSPGLAPISEEEALESRTTFWAEVKAKKEKKKPKAKKKAASTKTKKEEHTDENESNLKQEVKAKRKKAPSRAASIPVMTTQEVDKLGPVERIDFYQLNKEQQIGAQKILNGKNVFVTGNAGTGKTFLIRYIIQELIDRHGEESVAVTAPTGIAALNLNGMTIHSFAGIGLGEGERTKIMKKALTKITKERWQKCKTLIIDEVSMLDRNLFELLHELACSARNVPDTVPFGGIQVVLVGDFFQLPPVRRKIPEINDGIIDQRALDRSIIEGPIIDNHNNNNNTITINQKGEVDFCFHSPLWVSAGLDDIKHAWINLQKIERQSDERFIFYLNEIRQGKMSRQCYKELQQCLIQHKPLPTNGIIPTKLYAINAQVDQENNQRLAELSSPLYILTAENKWKEKPQTKQVTDYLLTAIDKIIPDKIELKVGAQVMLLRNRSRQTYGGQIRMTGPTLVNGSRGKIIAFTESILRPGLMVPTVQFDNGLITTIGPVDYSLRVPGKVGELIRSQVPLKLAW